MSRAVKYHEFGPASVLRVEEVDPPRPKPGKVRVAVRAAGLNPSDYKTREGMMSGPSFTFPAGIGRELAGVVEQLGEGVTSFSIGDEVFGNVASGAIADLMVTNPANLARKPAALDWVTAGGLSLAGQTAHDAVASQHLEPTDTVLVSAAAGGVGVLVAQLARLAGATVVGTASPGKHAFLESLGVVPVAYGPGLADRVRAVAPSGVTVVFDQHGRETIEAGIELGVDRSRINTIAADAAEFGVAGVGRGPIDPATLERLAALVVDGSLVVPIDSTFPLEETRAAFERLETGHARGKIVIVVD
jgi:NADPH:quinone reductase-like Zn-dependent oxidoreductase